MISEKHQHNPATPWAQVMFSALRLAHTDSSINEDPPQDIFLKGSLSSLIHFNFSLVIHWGGHWWSGVALICIHPESPRWRSSPPEEFSSQISMWIRQDDKQRDIFQSQHCWVRFWAGLWKQFLGPCSNMSTSRKRTLTENVNPSDRDLTPAHPLLSQETDLNIALSFLLSKFSLSLS